MIIKFFTTFYEFMETQKLEIDLNIVLEEIYGKEEGLKKFLENMPEKPLSSRKQK